MSHEQKIAYIDLLETIISAITDVEETTFWEPLLADSLVKYSVNNILSYFRNSSTIDTTLTAFVDGDETALDYSDAPKAVMVKSVLKNILTRLSYVTIYQIESMRKYLFPLDSPTMILAWSGLLMKNLQYSFVVA